MAADINKPKVTIGMPVYNGEKHIAKAIENLLSQDFSDFELIISDNASTDSTQEICKRYLGIDKRVSYYRNEENIGAFHNFNRLIGLAKGEYFMWAACDDAWEPSFISSLAGKLDSSPRSILAFCRLDLRFKNGAPAAGVGTDWRIWFCGPRFLRMANMIFMHYNSQKACMIYGLIRKEVLLKAGGFYGGFGEDVSQGYDIATLLKFLSYGPFVFTDDLLFHYSYREALDYQKKNIADNNNFIIRNLAQLKTDFAYKPLKDKYYTALREIVKHAPASFAEKALLNICILIEMLFELSKVRRILSFYISLIFRKLKFL